MVAETSFGNKKATGATFVTDAGGFVDKSTDAFPGFGELTPLAPLLRVGNDHACLGPPVIARVVGRQVCARNDLVRVGERPGRYCGRDEHGYDKKKYF